MVSRRKFIQLGSLASASLMVPGFLKGFEFRVPPATGSKVLVVVQLTGGNDGLNTVIPYRNDLYYRLRPKLSIAKNVALALTDETGLNPGMANIKRLYDEGAVSIVNGIGYEHPNRSHFRSMDIWQTGSAANELMSTGWLGRCLDAERTERGGHYSMMVEADDALSLALRGKDTNGIVAADVEQLYNAANNEYYRSLASHEHEHKERLAEYLYKTLRQTTASADYIYEQSRIYRTTGAYPNSEFGRRMKTIGSLIVSNAETRVYYISLGSFDTHVGQKERQQHLLEQVDSALAALVTDLKANNRFNDVLIMTFSEFGRRVEQNASNGTDHGAAGNMFFISGAIKKPGLYNEMPGLDDLDEGDLKYSVDFKSAYATVLDKWLKVKSKDILGQKYDHLNFI